MEISVYFNSNSFVRFLFLTGLTFVGISDWKYYRIPNKVIGLEMILGFISLMVQAGFMAAADKKQWLLAVSAAYVFRAVLVLIPGIFLSHFGLVGAGDMKLAAVLSAWFGLVKTGKILILGLLMGAILSLLKMLREGSTCDRFLYLSAYIRQVFNCKKMEKYYIPARDGTGCVIPLGACFCVGAFLVIFGNGGF